ncbi:hypothetical protein ACIQVE_02055 [Pseudomonas sp. NPDC098747]|uniref:hypothetical protein n=1 Tax=Pseudomonas sp. NPDC098747 TaxID=3364487 RepID=UPI00383A7AC7
MTGTKQQKRIRVLDPVERTTEVVFGLLMAMTFVGTLSVATATQEDVHVMLVAALGCNLAWGLADAVLYLIRSRIDRRRNRTLIVKLRETPDASKGRSLLADSLSTNVAAAAGPELLELLRQRLIESATPEVPVRLHWHDYKGALGVFLLVVLATLPVVTPFLFIDQASLAVRVSNVIAVIMLCISGWTLARYAGGRPWRSAVVMAAVGTGLLAAIIKLGG